jgi:hypothetical protein
MITEGGPTRIADFTATVVRFEDGPSRCTIHPRDVSDQDKTTVWISAENAAFSSVDEVP